MLLVRRMNMFKEEKSLQEKVKQIKKRWAGKRDSVGNRLISKLLKDYRSDDPLTKAILGDDLEFIQTYCIPKPSFFENEGPLFCFEAACLCASEKIAIFLLENGKIEIQEAKHTVGYALSTGDIDFALKIAQLMKAKGQRNIGGALVYVFGNYDNFEKVREVFEESRNLELD